MGQLASLAHPELLRYLVLLIHMDFMQAKKRADGEVLMTRTWREKLQQQQGDSLPCLYGQGLTQGRTAWHKVLGPSHFFDRSKHELSKGHISARMHRLPCSSLIPCAPALCCCLQAGRSSSAPPPCASASQRACACRCGLQVVRV